MRKHVLMVAAIFIIALPASASNLAERLCEDETFVSWVSQTEEIALCLATLSPEERDAYQASVSFSLQSERMARQLHQLSINYQLVKQADLDLVLASAAKQVSQNARPDNDCWANAVALFAICDALYSGNPEQWGACNTLVWNEFYRCMGPPI